MGQIEQNQDAWYREFDQDKNKMDRVHQRIVNLKYKMLELVQVKDD